jgi:hypothetical protein
MRLAIPEETPLPMLGFLADVEGFHRSMVAHHPCPNLARLAFGIV